MYAAILLASLPRARCLRAHLAVLVMLLAGLGLAACAEGTPAPAESDSVGGDVQDTSGGDVSGDTPEGCLPTACEIGTAICGGTGAFIRCADDGTGCGVLGDPVACGLSEVCESGACVPFETCIDGDGDGYGDGCAPGADCDDTNLGVNPGASEICGDQLDNDCAAGVDDGCADPCAGQACLAPQRRCTADGRLEDCVADAQGCGSWAAPVSCPSGVCADGLCQGCVDNDGDGRGAGCPLGEDCDDSDGARFSGNTELCDAIDNDCDGNVDEDYAMLGTSCMAGQGACQSTGQYQCASNQTSVVCDAVAGSPTPEQCGDNVDSDCDGNTDNGFESIGQSCTIGSGSCSSSGTTVCDSSNTRQTRCNAPAPTGTAETCDGADNDCDGQVDEGSICTSCTDDSKEQNDGSTSGTDLTTAKTISSLMLCGTDIDWFKLGTSPLSADIEIQHPTGNNGAGHPWANLNLEFFCGASYCSGMYGATNRSTFSTGACCTSGNTVTFRVYPDQDANPASGTPYSLIRR